MLTYDIVIEDPRWQFDALTALCTQVGDCLMGWVPLPDGAEAVLMVCDDARIKELNQSFRDKNAATNVLSWPSEDLSAETDGDMPVPAQDPELGDIALSYETCQREAAELGRRFEHHLTHLILHGTLHLLGFDHIRDADAARMEAIEIEVLEFLGIPNPYIDETKG